MTSNFDSGYRTKHIGISWEKVAIKTLTTKFLFDIISKLLAAATASSVGMFEKQFGGVA